MEGGGVLEADTKKRGRPAKFAPVLYEMWGDMEKRAAQNMFYVSEAINTLGQKPGDFFVTTRGNIRRQGIAEQIGRMLEAELITEDQARELAETAQDEYNSGKSVKEITNRLRYFRRVLEG